jgi:hypothetical protein
MLIICEVIEINEQTLFFVLSHQLQYPPEAVGANINTAPTTMVRNIVAYRRFYSAKDSCNLGRTPACYFELIRLCFSVVCMTSGQTYRTSLA